MSKRCRSLEAMFNTAFGGGKKAKPEPKPKSKPKFKHPRQEEDTVKDSERVFRLTRRDGQTYWSGPYDHADQFSVGVLPEEEVRHLSIADAFDAAGPRAEHPKSIDQEGV